MHNKHYTRLKYEPLELGIKLKNDLNFIEGSFLKYVSRYDLKGQAKMDIDKASFYCNGWTGNDFRPRDAVRYMPFEARMEVMMYCYDNNFKDWQNEAIFAFFKRHFTEADRALREDRK